MKYGLLVTSPRKNTKERFINIGDDIQAIAIRNIYREMEISDGEIVYLDFNDLSSYNGEHIILPICFNLQTDYNSIPFPPRIIPCFVGLSLFETSFITNETVNYLKRYEPIGCRDEQTYNLMLSKGIDAYLAGCVTTIFPRRKESDTYKKIFIVDVADELIKNIPSKIMLNNIEILSHILTGNSLSDYKEGLKSAEYRLSRYRDEAKLIITSRLHCLSPCAAMGIPVVGLFSNISPRMGWIDKLLPLHTEDDMQSVDWDGYKLNFEEIKEKAKNIIKQRIKDTFFKYNDISILSHFYEQRGRSKYGNYYYKKVIDLPFKNTQGEKYTLWGAGQVGKEVVRVMKESFPNVKLQAVIDSYSVGKDFMGMTIESPETIKEKYMNTFCIIASYSGKKYITDFLENIGKQDFLNFATVNG